MKHTFILLTGLSILLLAVFASQNTSVLAASFGGFTSVYHIDDGACATSSVNFTYELTGVTDDTGGNLDRVYEIYLDGNGDLIDLDHASATVGTTGPQLASGNGDNPNPIDVSPVTLYIYDTTSNSPFGMDETQENLDWVLANGTLLATSSYDVRNIPSCADVPYGSLETSPVSQQTPQIGLISISVGQIQPIYESAGGSVVRDTDNNEVRLPQDYDGNGFDTYLVMSSTEIDGHLWYQIFIGDGASLVWVPADNVTIVE